MTLDKGLLPLCNEIGVTKPLIDTATTAIGAGAGSAAAFTFVSKSVYGYPTGLGIHNAPSSWTWLKKYKKTNRNAFEMCDIGSNVIAQMMGADYILYGPIKNASKVFPLIAMTDILSAESASIEFGMEASDNHPFKKLLK
jgi:tetrahydromethanopterin S-methyltransferase subunit H